MAEAFTFTKGLVEQYRFRGPHFSWAVITLDPGGIFQAVSDFGTYAYSGWRHHGCASFKHFLIEMTEADYFISKVCSDGQGLSGPGRAGMVFTPERTLKDLRRSICEQRREEGLTKSEAASCWEEIEVLGDVRDENEFVHVLMDSCPDTFDRLFGGDACDASDACRHELAAAPLRFFNEIVRGQLVPVLEAEIAAEQKAPRPEALR
jgi:hypothetical protein